MGRRRFEIFACLRRSLVAAKPQQWRLLRQNSPMGKNNSTSYADQFQLCSFFLHTTHVVIDHARNKFLHQCISVKYINLPMFHPSSPLSFNAQKSFYFAPLLLKTRWQPHELTLVVFVSRVTCSRPIRVGAFVSALFFSFIAQRGRHIHPCTLFCYRCRLLCRFMIH